MQKINKKSCMVIPHSFFKQITDISPTELRVLLILAKHTDNNNETTISLWDISAKADVSHKNLYKHLKSIEKIGFVKVMDKNAFRNTRRKITFIPFDFD